MEPSIKPFKGFVPLKTHHCVTGSLRHIYAFHGCDISEDLLLGLGEGVGFSYWHFKGQPPFLGGRGLPKPSMEEIAGQRTGVIVELHTSTSPDRARRRLLDELASGQPVMLGVDMGYLPYFDFGGQEYHFGGHVVVACGYDLGRDEVLLADRDGLHPVPIEALEKARGSNFKPFPPHHLWYSFDFSRRRPPTAEEVHLSIAAQSRLMLNAPIHNIGIRGIQLAAERIPRWPDRMNAEEIRLALFNVYIFISPVGGTGGGAFRVMFSRFLREAAALTGDDRLTESAEIFKQIGDDWEALADWSKQVSELPDPGVRLGECTPLLASLAGQEEAAWKTLLEING
jgi:hypothetical protein